MLYLWGKQDGWMDTCPEDTKSKISSLNHFGCMDMVWLEKAYISSDMSQNICDTH